jgi:hypothetical protein
MSTNSRLSIAHFDNGTTGPLQVCCDMAGCLHHADERKLMSTSVEKQPFPRDLSYLQVILRSLFQTQQPCAESRQASSVNLEEAS